MTDVEIRKELYRLIDTQRGDRLMYLYDVVKDTLGIHKMDSGEREKKASREEKFND